MSEVAEVAERHGMDLGKPLALVSGGSDSVALLRVLCELGSTPRVLHVDHGLRGADSEADAKFASTLCEELGVPFRIEQLNLTKGSGMQQTARRERYRLAKDLSERYGCTSIATGHNAGDVGETLLMNLARGAGTRGAAAIPVVSGEVVRPLITATRDEILAYLKEIGQPYRTDASNLEGKYSRNRVRQEVIPALESLYPGASRNLTRAATLFRKDLEVLEELASRAVVHAGDGETVIEMEKLIHPGLLGHALRVAYASVLPGTMPLDLRVIQQIGDLLERPNGTRTLDLPGGVFCAVRFGERIVFRRGGSLGGGRHPSAEMVELPESGEARFKEWLVRVDKVSALDRANAARPEVCYLDERFGPYRVREVREGDTIRPLGLGGTKKVLRAMMDRKVPKDLRHEVPVVVGVSGHVAWVFFGETGEDFAIHAGTKAVIRLEISGGREF
ncbi:MAG: tRNA lysidine(34) synthetase TilS [Rubrobacter sp.]